LFCFSFISDVTTALYVNSDTKMMSYYSIFNHKQKVKLVKPSN